MKDTVVILNPAARGARAQRMRAQVEALARGAIVQATSHSGEAEVLARHAAAEGYEKIVAAGGDGTINEIVNGIAGRNVALGLLPIGTMNVFAVRKSGEMPVCVCGIVMPLSFNPAQGVTLIRRTCRGVSSRWPSSC